MARREDVPTHNPTTPEPGATPANRNEQVTVLGQTAGPREVELAPIVDDPTVTGSALDRNAPPAKEREGVAVEEIFAQVVETRVVNDVRSGGRVTLRAGKVLSSKHYDLMSLKQQGLKMSKYEPDALPDMTSLFG